MRRFLILGGLLAATVSALVAGCEKSAPSPVTVSSGGVDLTEADIHALDTALNERKGQVVLVDFWATWCPPCRARFPHFVEMHNKFAGKGLVCMSVSCDNEGPHGPTDKRDVVDFLNSKGATFKNFLLTGYRKDAEAIGRRFGFDASLPFVALFGKDGKKVWDSEQKSLNDDDLDKLIESELAK